jgi:hypothetical protein
VPPPPPGRFWVGAEFLIDWIRKGPSPGPLLTTATGFEPNLGAIPGPTTRVLYGQEMFNYGAFPGGRFSVGEEFGAGSNVGFQLRGFFTEAQSIGAAASPSSKGNLDLFRPFVEALPDGSSGPTALVIASTGAQVGGFSVHTSSQIWGAEGDLLCGLLPGCDPGHGFVVGLYYLNLAEKLGIDNVYTPLPGHTVSFGGKTFGPGNVVTISDRFETRNWFAGSQFAGRYRWNYGDFFVEGEAGVALGATHEVVYIFGNTSLLSAGATPGTLNVKTLPGGLLASGSNTGTRTHEQFGAVPNTEVKFGWNVAPWCTLHLAYDFMYWTSVARPGNQVDYTINPTQVPASSSFSTTAGGPSRPQVPFTTGEIWVQGIVMGVEFRF